MTFIYTFCTFPCNLCTTQTARVDDIAQPNYKNLLLYVVCIRMHTNVYYCYTSAEYAKRI